MSTAAAQPTVDPRTTHRVQIAATFVLLLLVALAAFGWVKHNADTQQQNGVDQLACAMRADAAGGSYVWTPDGGCQIIH